MPVSRPPRSSGSSQDRRRARRAGERRAAASLSSDALVAAASDDLPEDVDPELGGKPNQATKPDRRLKENKPPKGMEVSPTSAETLPEDDFLAAIEAFDDLSPEESAQARALAVLAGIDDEVAWGPSDGFSTLLDDVNETLAAAEVRAIDAGVLLDKILLADRDGESYVAPMTIDEQGEPHVAARDSWILVDGEGLQAKPALARFVLRNFAFETVEKMLPDAHKPGERIPKRTSRTTDPTPPAGASTARGPIAWTADFVPEATLTDDGRAFAPDALAWRDLPLTLMGLNETSAEGGHDGAVACGRIDQVWREMSDGRPIIRASGVFSSDEIGSYYATNVGDGTIRGLSVDIAIHEYEVGPRSDYFDADGNWLAERPVKVEDEEPQSLVDLLFGEESDEQMIFVITSGVIGMATVCPFPAFAEASISLAASGAIWRYTHQGRFAVVEGTEVLVAAAVLEAEPEVAEPEPEREGESESLTAASAGAAPLRPPVEWFENPELDELTALTVSEDGRIFGHAWAWDTCHIAFPDSCVTAPHSNTQNAYFHLGEIECDGGERVACGRITLDTGHAGQRLSRTDALRHYDDTGTVAAHIVCGEDEHGGWFSGAICPDLSEEKLRILRGAALSGDWRGVNGSLELVALLAVNVPGFPVPRVRALVASGADGAEPLALTAAGIVLERTDEDDFREIEALAAEARGDFDDLVAEAQG